LKYTPKELSNNVNISKTSPVRELLVLLGGILLFLIIVYVALGFAVDIVVEKLPMKMEENIGRFYLIHYAMEEPQTPVERRLQNLLDKIQANIDSRETDFQIHTIELDKPNALALPGGHVAVTKSLLASMESENELAMILSHELGHFANKDHLRGLGRGLVLAVISNVVLGKDNPASKFLQNSLLKAEMKFSQKQERESDEYGLHLLNKTYGHCAGATDFFRKMKKRERSGKLAHFFSTHPMSGDRISNIEKLIEKNNYEVRRKTPLKI
jgi:predicted Zn-dependent protease